MKQKPDNHQEPSNDNKKIFWSTVIASLSFIVGAGGVAAMMHEQNQNRIHDQLVNKLKIEIDNLTTEKNIRLDARKQFINSALEVRTARAEEIDACQRGLRSSEQEKHFYAVKRLIARLHLISVLMNAKFAFKDIADEIKQIAGELPQFDFNIKDVCAPTAPAEAEWKKFELKDINLLDKSVDNFDRLILEKKKAFAETN